VVIGSDVIVSVEGKQYGKPEDASEAHAMLRAESGRCNLVTASVAVVCRAEKFQEVTSLETKIYLKPYNDQAVEAYMKTGDWHDKAGAYGVQSGAAPLIDFIEGRYDVILGIPTNILVALLKRLGIEAHEAIITSPSDLVFK
jgi:septum formation protein